jgi:hypothetical protein
MVQRVLQILGTAVGLVQIQDQQVQAVLAL